MFPLCLPFMQVVVTQIPEPEGAAAGGDMGGMGGY